MKVSFIVPAFNEEGYIGECLDSIIRHAAEHIHEIIVVDNGSTDRTAEIASMRDGVRVIAEPRLGVTHARQRGFKEAAGDLLAYVDADTRLPPEWIKIALDSYERDCNLVCLSGPYRYYDGRKITRCFLGVTCWIALATGFKMFGYMVNGGNFVVTKRAMADVQGFDLGIDFFGDDADVARRLRCTGKSLFRTDFFIFTSARRFYAEGLIKTLAIYMMNFLWVALFLRPYSTSHVNVRSSFPARV